MMATAVKTDRYIKTDVNANNNKFWHITLFDDGTVETHWGRVGDTGQKKILYRGSQYGAECFFENKCGEKTGKGYRQQQTLEANGKTEVKVNPNQNLAEVARQQLKTSCQVTMDLVAVLAKENVHHILSSTTMSYDATKGLFSTPLGIVTAGALRDARRLLAEIGQYVAVSDYDNQGLIMSLNDYMMLIPQNVGRQRPDPRRLYPDLAAIQRQNDLLDALDASLQQALTAQPAADSTVVTATPQLFDATLTLVEDGNEIDRIRKKYKDTWQGQHGASVLAVKRVFMIEIAHMRRAFEEDGVKLDNLWELWHGSKKGNLLSILSKGFVIPPSNAAHCTGRMFGNGVYFSDQSTKSLNYAWGYWDGRQDDNCFMFLANVGMGKYYVPPHSMQSLPMKGYDSTYAQGGKSGVGNNEMIVYRTSQIDPVFLVEFSRGGR
jgi:poly [ADP-ribose] polymerase